MSSVLHALYVEEERLIELYNYYLLRVFVGDYESNLQVVRKVRKNLKAIQDHIKELEEL